MKKLLGSLLALVGALIVTIIYLPFGIPYTLGYGIWFSRREKKKNRWFALGRFFVRLIDGVCDSIGHAIYHGIAYVADLNWNIFGELIEDCVTKEDNTTFTKKGVSVSASIGYLEMSGKLNSFGKKFSKALNIVFNQRSHAVGAAKALDAQEEIKKLYNPK